MIKLWRIEVEGDESDWPTVGQGIYWGSDLPWRYRDDHPRRLRPSRDGLHQFYDRAFAFPSKAALCNWFTEDERVDVLKHEPNAVVRIYCVPAESVIFSSSRSQVIFTPDDAEHVEDRDFLTLESKCIL